MTWLGLVRHGSTNWNLEKRVQGQTDIPLNAEGRAQGRLLADRLNNEKWDVIYSSDLSRAAETANIVATALGGVPVILDERLREVNYGQKEGTTEEERLSRWGPDWKDRDLPGREDPIVLRARGMSFVYDMIQRHPNDRVLVFSHKGWIKSLLQHLVPHEQMISSLHNTSVTSLKFVGDQWICELFNCAKHLNEND